MNRAQTLTGALPSTMPFRLAQWRMLLAAMFCYLFFYPGRQTFGFAIPGIQAEFGLSKETLGWASTAMLCASLTTCTIGGTGAKPATAASTFPARAGQSASASLVLESLWLFLVRLRSPWRAFATNATASA